MEGSIDLVVDLWQHVLTALESKFSRSSYEGWIKQVKPLSLEEDTLIIGVASEFTRDWLEKRAGKLIRSTASKVLDRQIQVQFRIAQMGLPLEAKEGPAPVRSRPRKPADDLSTTPLHPRYTFDNFVVGKGNQFAQAAAQAVAKAPGVTYNPLFLHGGVGLGKTHLMQAIGHHVQQVKPGQRVAYVSGDTFTYHVVTSIREDRFAAFRRRYREVDLWLVDDIQFIASRERTEAEFFHTFNALYETDKQIVITSDRPPKDLQVMDPRLRSRFEAGLTADIKPPDLETRIAILQRKAQMEKASVPDEVVQYIASVVTSNIRVLEGALIKVLAAASFSDTEVSLPLAIQHLKDYATTDAINPMSIEVVQKVVAEHFKLTPAELNGTTRRQEIVFPRQLAMYLARILLSASYPEIARRFGGKDHSTVIHACRKLKDQVEADPSTRSLVEQLSSRLQRK